MKQSWQNTHLDQTWGMIKGVTFSLDMQRTLLIVELHLKQPKWRISISWGRYKASMGWYTRQAFRNVHLKKIREIEKCFRDVSWKGTLKNNCTGGTFNFKMCGFPYPSHIAKHGDQCHFVNLGCFCVVCLGRQTIYQFLQWVYSPLIRKQQLMTNVYL